MINNQSGDNRHKKNTEMITDRFGNYIGSNSEATTYRVEDFSNFPQISSSVSKSTTTESVYVRYYNSDNSQSIVVRFSDHSNNATLFGDQLDWTASREEILFHLGLATRTFIPNTRLFIDSRQVSKKTLHQYEEAELTIGEMYELGTGADLSDYTGKLAKGSNYLIQGTKVKEFKDTRIDAFGNERVFGKFVYQVK